MNFDELKEQWSKQSSDDVTIKNDLLFKKANTPIDKVRKQIRLDFYSSIIMLSILFIGAICFLDIPTKIQYVIYITTLLMVLFGLYYGIRIFKFYKESYNLEYNSKEALLWFYYELKLIIEMIKSYSFISFFIGLIAGFITGTLLKKTNSQGEVGELISGLSINQLIIGIVIIYIVTFVGIEFLIKYAYGRYLKQIKQILDELKE